MNTSDFDPERTYLVESLGEAKQRLATAQAQKMHLERECTASDKQLNEILNRFRERWIVEPERGALLLRKTEIELAVNLANKGLTSHMRAISAIEREIVALQNQIQRLDDWSTALEQNQIIDEVSRRQQRITGKHPQQEATFRDPREAVLSKRRPWL